jgi:tetratricopeptide (TPR) repeat protein
VQALLGDFYLAKRDVPRAREAYDRALSLRQGWVTAVAGLVAVDLTQKKPEAARARVEAQLASSPNNEAVLQLAGRTFLALGDPARAESTYRHLLEVNPVNMQAYAVLGGLYLSQNRLDEARTEYQNASRREPKSAVVGLTMAGTILTLQGKDKEARALYEQVLALDPQMPVAANNLAWDYAESGSNLDVALQLAQTAKARLPNNSNVSDTLGWIYYKKGFASRAVSSLQEAAKLAPENPSIHYRLGLAYLKNGEEKKARASFEGALKLSSQFKEAEEAKKALATLKG